MTRVGNASASEKPYRVLVWWKCGGAATIAAESDNPTDLAGAPTVARNARAIRRIEIHDLTGCLETVWDSAWVAAASEMIPASELRVAIRQAELDLSLRATFDTRKLRALKEQLAALEKRAASEKIAPRRK